MSANEAEEIAAVGPEMELEPAGKVIPAAANGAKSAVTCENTGALGTLGAADVRSPTGLDPANSPEIASPAGESGAGCAIRVVFGGAVVSPMVGKLETGDAGRSPETKPGISR